MNMQEVFQHVWVSVSLQNGPSTIGYLPRLRGDYKRKCAVGFLIPDDKYLEEMEMYSVEKILKKLKLDLSPIFVYELRNAHDNEINTSHKFFKEKFRQNMMNVAMDFKLNIPSELFK